MEAYRLRAWRTAVVTMTYSGKYRTKDVVLKNGRKLRVLKFEIASKRMIYYNCGHLATVLTSQKL
jgi:hypothetical protein